MDLALLKVEVEVVKVVEVQDSMHHPVPALAQQVLQTLAAVPVADGILLLVQEPPVVLA
jgi:hypothetical protein